MSKVLIKQRILKEKPKSTRDFGMFEDTDADAKIFLHDPNIFLLNKLLLSIQFFENYERDIEILRENWFKEVSLESYHKKCFYADSLFRESGAKVKFSPLHGINKNSKDLLHPLRIYIFSDNVEAAFDPTVLGRSKRNVWPQYQLQVKMDENDEKLGSVSLVLFKTLEMPQNSLDSTKGKNENLNFSYVKGKYTNDIKEKKLARTNQTLNFKIQERGTLKSFKETQDGMIPSNSFYCFATPEESLISVSMVKYRMNNIPASNQEIPELCFQREILENALGTRRRIPHEKFNRQRSVLNSAAFKSHFCDILIEKLGEPLGFNVDDIQEGIIHQEFAIFGQKIKTYITQAIEISDWSNFISLAENRYNAKFTPEVAWPTNQMWEIMSTLPCYAVPNGVPDLSRKSLDYEKKWKLDFPKTEQFLLLHMMHSQIRCYFFILSIYKSFIEPEINIASLGPKHLLHLLFWQVHKNFLAWPEERPAETLLSYLKILYKKLQNKFLRDFFINSRNLFASSFAKDMHKAQALIKMILQNPVPYVLQAIRNLEYDSNFYPAFEALKINAILSPLNTVKNRPKKLKKEKKENKVCFEDLEERLSTESTPQMQLLLKPEEQESVQSLFELMSNEKLYKEDLKALRQKINNLKEKCDELEREGQLNQTRPLGKTKLFSNPTRKLKSQQQMMLTENDTPEKDENIYEKNITKIKVLKRPDSSDHIGDEKEDWETKL